MTATYFAIATDVGNAKDANAKALGLPRKYVALAIGDGGGDNAPVPTPKTSQKALLGEWRRAALNSLDVDPKAPSQLIAEQVIPETEGGKWIRELGLFDEDGDLCYVSNAPPTYKPTLPEGSGKTQSVRMVIVNSSGVNVELKIDPSVILATREYVDKGLKAHVDALDPHTQYFKKVGGAISGPVTIGGVDDDLNATRLSVFGRVRGASSTGALTASNGKGVGQTSIHLMREGADVDAKTWEFLHGSSGSFALRAISDDYKSSTTVFSVDRPAGITSAVMRLMQSGGRLLVGGSPDDGTSALQVKGGATFDTPPAGDRTRRGATAEFVGGELAGYYTKDQAKALFAPGQALFTATGDFTVVREDNWITMSAAGGGGGAGGRDASGLCIPGGGGGAGQRVFRMYVKLVVGTVVRVTIGKGGKGAITQVAPTSTPLPNGTAGGASSFGTFITLNGGGPGNGGFAGSGSVGGAGGFGYPSGGSGEYTGTATGQGARGGAGGSGIFGGGGASVHGYQTTSVAATGYGSGGGGGSYYYGQGADANGGDGFDGFCIVEW